MSVSGNEEPAVKSFARRSSDSVAGIPIKKRRFMLFPHSSPPSHAQTSPPAEKNLVEKEQLNPSQESSLKDASVVTSSSLSDAKKNSPGGKCQSSVANLVQSNDNLSRVKNEESSLTVESGSLHDRDKKDKFIVAKKSGSQIGSGNTELQLAPKDHLVLNVKKEILREQNVEGNVEGTGTTNLPSLTVESGSLHDRDRKDKFIVLKKSESQIGSGNTELQLAPKDHLVLNVNNEILREGNVEGTGKTCLPSLTVGSGSPDDRDRKDKFIVTKKSGGQVVTGNTKLQLAPKEVLVRNVRKEISREQKVQGNHISESSIALGNTELSLGPKEPPVLALAGQHGEGSCQMQEKLDPISWNLSLSKGKSSTECKSDEIDLKVHGIHLHANRSNWDLNTTMDAWEGSLNDAAAGQRTTSHSGLDEPSGICDIKPVISSTEMIGTLVASGKQRPISSEHQSRFAILNPPDQQYKSDDSLSLRLSPSSCLQSNTHHEHLSAAAKEDSSSAFSNSDFPRVMVSSCKPNRDGHTIVKSESIDDSTKKGYKAKAKLMGLLDGRTVKNESVERRGLEALKSANLSALKLDATVIKSEPAVVGIQETPKATGETFTLNHSGVQVPQGLTNCSSSLPLPITSLMRHPSELPTRSTQLFISGDVLRQSECSTTPKGVHHNRQLQKESGEVKEQVASVVVSTSSCDEVKESNVSDGMVDIQGAENANVDSNDLCRLKLIDELPLDLCENDDGSVSDEEKINISADMLEEGSYDSDYESDGNYALDTAMDANQYGGEDDDYEDGEVREPLEETAMEGPVSEKIIAEDVNCDSDNRKTDFLGVTCDDQPSSSQIEECSTKVEDSVETNNDCSKGCINTVLNEETDLAVDKDSSLQEPLASEMPTLGENKNESVKITRREPLEISGRCAELKNQGAELSYEQTTTASQGAPVTFNQGTEEKNKSTDLEVNNESALPMAEASLSGDVAAKDANSAGNRSRIITLSRSSNVSPSGKTRFIPGRPLPSRTGRERFTDPVLEEKVYPRGRDEFYFDTQHKYLRERNQDQSLRNSRLNYMRGRGRGSRRFNTPRSDWDSDRDFAPDLYNDSAEFRFPRHKHASALADTELECNDYMIAPDDSVVGPGRGGRKPLNDEVPIFRHPTSRRRSPGGRDGPLRGVQMVRRTPRNISPNRCIDDDGSEMIGLRHTEKFLRGLPDDDDIDPMFTRPQTPYEEVDSHFIRGNRNFSSLQGRGMPRVRSKSPLRSRTRSPGPWPSPRRRSPEGFNGHPGLTRRRSPQVYRMERMRSPDRPCFPREMMTRRHGSPPFLSRPSSDMRDMDSGREHTHPRSVICNRRSPPGRVLPRNNSRRFEIVDPRERTGDEYFGQHVHPGRFDEVGGDGSGDDRRRIGERRGPIRSFRPPYNSSDGEDFRFNVEDAPRPYRLCPEGEPEFHERGNLREREFDRRIKNRPGNAPRRMRSIEEQEGNYRQGGQVWHDDGFNNIQLKRRRF